MGIQFPCTFWDSDLALPVQFYIQRLYLLILIRNYRLFVRATQVVSVRIVPTANLVRLVVFELTLIECPVGEHPPALLDRVIVPLPHQFHPALLVCVCPLPHFLPELPPSRIAVLVRIQVRSLAMLDSVLPLTYTNKKSTIILALILIRQPAYSMLVVVLEVSFVPVPVHVDVLALPLPDTVQIIPMVLLTVWVLSVSFSSVVSWRNAALPALWCKLVRYSALVLCHLSLYLKN